MYYKNIKIGVQVDMDMFLNHNIIHDSKSSIKVNAGYLYK